MRKRKIGAAMLLCVTMSLSMLSGCADNTKSNTSASADAAGTSIVGVVKEVGDDSLVIEEGSFKERSEESSTDSSGGQAAGGQEEAGDAADQADAGDVAGQNDGQNGAVESQDATTGSQDGSSDNQDGSAGNQDESSDKKDGRQGQPPQGGPGGNDQQNGQQGQPPQGGPGGNDQQNGQQGQPPQGGPGGNDQQNGQQGQPPQGQPPEGAPGDNNSQDASSDSQDKDDSQNNQDNNGSQGQEGTDSQESQTQQGQQGQPPQGQPGGSGGPSAEDILDLTGEEKTITVTTDTVVTSGHPQMDDKKSGQDDSQNQAGDQQGAQADSQTQDQSQTTDQQEAFTGNQGDAQSESTVDGLEDLKEGDIVSIELDDDGNAKTITVMTGGMNGGSGGPGGNGQGMPGGGQSSQPDSYTAVTSYVEDGSVSDESYSSTGTDENAVLIDNGATITLDNATVTRNSDSSTGGDSSSFYGVGAAVLNKEGTLYVKGGTVDTDANGGAGIFSYGDQSTTYVSDTKISTQKGTSGGLHVAGGGTLYAWDVTAETSGESSAAIRSDRGGGTMVVDGGTYTSNGTGSPAVYTTADISINNAELTATGSEAVCIEGLNTLRLYDSKVTGNMPESDQNDCTWNVILYQSMSGDSEEGNSTFDMEGGSLTAKNGGMFYTTNTESTFILNNVDITYADENDFFLKCTGNSNARGWGTTGQNGAKCTFTAIDQEMEGDIIWDSISTLDLYMTDGSSLKGAVKDDESNAGGSTGDGYCNLVISKDSTWTVTGDSTLTSLSSEGSIVDEEGRTVTIKGTDGTVYVNGDSEYTITVSEYKDSADLSGASSASSFQDVQVAKPDQLK